MADIEAKLKAKFGETSRIAGKGAARRKKKVVRKKTVQDDKKLQALLKKMNANPIPGIEEANFFKEDGNILHFKTPSGSCCRAACVAVWCQCDPCEAADFSCLVLSCPADTVASEWVDERSLISCCDVHGCRGGCGCERFACACVCAGESWC